MNLLKDHQGRFRTQSIFIEYKHPDFSSPFTLKDEDTAEAISMYRLYMEIADPTEYEAATQLLGSWEHWQLLAGDKHVKAWFLPYITRWRAELQNKLASEHYKRMQSISVTGKTASERMAAIKWLASRQESGSRGESKRGRPSKDELNNRLKDELKKLEDLDNDAKRIGL